MKTVLGIDISSMLNTNYYGSGAKPIKDTETQEEYKKRMLDLNLLHTSDGRFTNALSSTMRTIITLILEWRPDYIVTASDKSRKDIFRTKKYPLYKGNRSKTPCLLSEQKAYIVDCLRLFGIPIFDADGYEADDIIYTVTKMFDDGNHNIKLVTKDHDYWQLANKNVTIWMPQNSKEIASSLRNEFNLPPISPNTPLSVSKMVPFGPNEVLKKSGVFPEMIPDLKGITGDSSDNIPGVKGVASAAAPMLMYWGTIEEIYKALEKNETDFKNICKTDLGIKKDQSGALKSDKYSAILSKELATMVEVPCIKELNKEAFIPNYNIEGIKAAVAKYELKSILGDAIRIL